ncbi:hypothetical protein [Kitasatospora purpeofusca]|uniref:hypothetical protein n=1 Tax=Kitasatospora purpeofusca TaxID=67352 RepID=UPI00386837E4
MSLNHLVRRRRLTLTAAGLLALVAGFGTAATPAHAAAGTTVCTGASSITYSPGLTTTPRLSTYAETDSYTCTSTDATLTSGSIPSGSYTTTLSCLNPLTTGAFDYTVDWNNGQSTTFAVTSTETIALGIMTFTAVGTAVSGEFTGATATIVWAYTVPNPLACLTSTGITGQSGTIIATIIGTS